MASNGTKIEIHMTAHGQGDVKINGQQIPCISAHVSLAVNQPNIVQLQLHAEQVSLILEDAILAYEYRPQQSKGSIN